MFISEENRFFGCCFQLRPEVFLPFPPFVNGSMLVISCFVVSATAVVGFATVAMLVMVAFCYLFSVRCSLCVERSVLCGCGVLWLILLILVVHC